MRKSILLAAAALLVLGCGIFTKPTPVEKTTSPVVLAVVTEYIGPYHKTAGAREDVRKTLEELGETPINGIGIYHDDPKVTPKDKLRSDVGFTVDHQLKLEGAYTFTVREPREVAKTTFTGHPAVGAVKAYAALETWMDENGYEGAGPCVEIYEEADGKMTTTYYVPIRKAEAAPAADTEETAE